MIGQKKILSQLNNYSLENIPHSMLFVGDSGCGKHTLALHMQGILSLPLIDITKDINFNFISDMYTSTLNSLYLINLNLISEKQQNVILKLLEEPPKLVYLILISDSKSNVLPTILNRCTLFEFEPYSKEELKLFVEKKEFADDIVSICTTPGQILQVNLKNIEELKKICKNIVLKIGSANYPNALSIVSKINFKDEFDKYDFKVFLNALSETFRNLYIENKDIKIFNLYKVFLNEVKKLKDSRLNKEIFMYNLITKLWKEDNNDN